MPPPPYSSKDFRHFCLGFTLAEVLITLAIIGIIAALTIPTLMNKVQDHGFRSAFLKNYAMIKNVERLAYQQEGERLFAFSNLGLNKYYTDDILKKYFKIEEEIIRGGWNQLGFLYNYDYRKESILWEKTLKGLNGKSLLPVNGSTVQFKTADGSIISFLTANGWPWIVYIDVNGAQKPNVVGRDIFFLEAHHNWNWEIVPVGTYASSIANTCKMNKSGLSCGAEIIKNRSFKIPKE